MSADDRSRPAAAEQASSLPIADIDQTSVVETAAEKVKGGGSFDIEQPLGIGSGSTGAGAGKTMFNAASSSKG
ncbi:MAG: hypothetical protein ACREPM_03630 [Gemmatimonadaceae bacterium]